MATPMTTKESTILASQSTSPPTFNITPLDAAEIRVKVCVVDLALGDLDAADIIELCNLPADAVVLDIWRSNEDLGTSLTVDIGLYTLAAVVKDVDTYGSAIELGAASAVWVSNRFESAAAGGLITNFGQQVFADAGDSDNSEGEYILAATVVTSTSPAAGRLNIMVFYSST